MNTARDSRGRIKAEPIPTTVWDALGMGAGVGTVLVGIQPYNAGRSCTVKKIGRRGKLKCVDHLSGRTFDTWICHYRVAV